MGVPDAMPIGDGWSTSDGTTFRVVAHMTQPVRYPAVASFGTFSDDPAVLFRGTKGSDRPGAASLRAAAATNMDGTIAEHEAARRRSSARPCELPVPQRQLLRMHSPARLSTVSSRSARARALPPRPRKTAGSRARRPRHRVSRPQGSRGRRDGRVFEAESLHRAHAHWGHVREVKTLAFAIRHLPSLARTVIRFC